MLIQDIRKQYGLMASFNATLIPLNRMLAIAGLTIPVNYLPGNEPVTVQIKENGVVIHCDHAGAAYEDITFNAGLDDERTERHLACDKCPAWFMKTDDGGEWIDG